MKYFLDLAGFNARQLDDLLSLAKRLDDNPDPTLLAGRVLTLLLMDQSFHTVASFQAAMARLGGQCIALTPPGGLETDLEAAMVDTQHHAREALGAVGGYSDVIGIRAHGPCDDLAADLREELFRAFAKACPKPLINLGSAVHHPCQGLADMKTLDEIEAPGRGGRLALTWVYDTQPRPLAAAATALHVAAARGMRVAVHAPPGYQLPRPLIEKARAIASVAGGSVVVADHRDKAMDAAHVVYGASWPLIDRYGDREADLKRRPALTDWCVAEKWFASAQETCRYMQSLPVRRELSATADVLDGPRSAVVTQARNRVPVQMAILHRMILGKH